MQRRRISHRGVPAVFLCTVVLLFGLLAACADLNESTSQKEALHLGSQSVFPIKIGDQVVHMTLAVTSSERQRGLKHQRTLDEDAGMLFVFPSPQQLSFWMQQTPLPLDIGYFSSEGVLKEVYALYPHSLEKVSSNDLSLQLALEVNRGWYARNKLTPGAQIDMDAVRAALKLRGIEPQNFGL